MNAALDSSTFRSMGCDVVLGGAAAAVRANIEELFSVRDRRFSPFRQESELNRVNAVAGTAVGVSEDFAGMLALALQARCETGGVVDPTLGRELEGAEAGISYRRARAAVRLTGTVVRASRGVKLDLNGVVKGRTVDDAMQAFSGDGFVSAGGDLATRGALVAALPHGGTVRLLRGALATSGIDRRQWIRDGTVAHHLIDPATGLPSLSPWEQVTVCGQTCTAADIAAKAAFLLGEAGPDWLDGRSMPGRFVGRDGEVVLNASWRAAVTGDARCT